MKILMIGDVIGEPGRKAVAKLLPSLKSELNVEFTTANVENLAGGFGVTPEVLRELAACGVDAFTSGNHIWDKKQVIECIEKFPQLLRPANYPEGAPGRGHSLFTSASGVPVGVVSLQGRAFMPPIDCPFRTGQRLVRELKGLGARVILVDMHAEATAEKVALAAYLDGEASLVAGTHTHVPTADARLSAKGTAAITDLGMTGGHDGIIGMKKDGPFRKLLLQVPTRYEAAEGDVQLWGALVDVDEATGRALSLAQVHRKL